MGDADRPPLDALLLLLVERTSRLLRQRVDALGLSMPLALALRELERPVPMRNLARALRCDASNLTGIADRLEQRGLAERRADPADRRVKLLVLTEEGRAVRRVLLRSVAADLTGLDRLSLAERDQLGELLWRLLCE